MVKYSIVLITLIFSSFFTAAQSDEFKLVQLSGVVVSEDSLEAVPFTTIRIKNSSHGTISDVYGYFSLVAAMGDTIQFSSIGYQSTEFEVPDTLSGNRYSMIQILVSDTVLLKEYTVYPWPSREQFKQAFLNLDIPDDDIALARKNIERAKLKAMFSTLPNDPGENFNYQMQQVQTQLYYTGQYPPITLLNPFAWAQFIESWKRGDFKKKN
jgi:hypothetical protein